jgi:diguanylate cyclase (GGDEF)-like protein
VVADLDAFKAINDLHGHGEGDRVLREVAAALRRALRLPDACFRWGGDEFVALLPDTTLEQAAAIAERLRAATGGTTVEGQPILLTAGVAQLRGLETGEELLTRADDALLQGKAARQVAV